MIEESYQKQIKAIFFKALGSKKFQVFIFGSRAKKNNRKNSDLDLLLDCDFVIEGHVKVELDYLFEESNLPFRVDLLIKSELDPQFLKKIENSIIKIIDTTTTYNHNYEINFIEKK